MTDDMLYSVWQGSFRLFGVDVKCHILSDGQRIIEADSMSAVLEAMARNDGPPFDQAEATAFAKWRQGG